MVREASVRPSGPDSDPDGAPRRLHPATLLITLVRRAPSALLAIPALLAAMSRFSMGSVLATAAAAFLAVNLLRWATWYRFTYALTADAVVIDSGLFSRNRRTIPYGRVADVGIERRPLQRLFGLATVTLETGGAGADEGALDSVSVAEAERLRAALGRRRAAAFDHSATGCPMPADAVSEPAAPVVFAMSPRRVTLWGLFNFSLVWIALGFGLLQYAGRALDLDDAALWDVVVARTETARSLSMLARAGAAALAVALVLAVGVVAGVVRTTLRDHGFRLTDEGGRLRRKRGLLTRSEAIVSLPRVQLAAIDTGPLRRRLGWARLRAQVFGGEGAGGRQDLAPFARADEVDRLLGTLRLRRVSPAEMTPVARGHVWRALARRVGVPALLILAVAAVRPVALLALPFLLPTAAWALLDRRHHRYRLASGLLQVQRGVWGRTDWIVPTAYVQVATVRRSWLQRRLGLATLLVDTAGGGAAAPDIHDLAEADGWRLLDALTGERARDRAAS
ncbi:PH domain-containing protein [uncultured Sphingomonas sp.]|uniref:PH domain-containing protein n=1 Tax=uncultured Sphingomonas sp. TaxID=158754 RepID=UPI0035CB3791